MTTKILLLLLTFILPIAQTGCATTASEPSVANEACDLGQTEGAAAGEVDGVACIDERSLDAAAVADGVENHEVPDGDGDADAAGEGMGIREDFGKAFPLFIGGHNRGTAGRLDADHARKFCGMQPT